jgi:SAM-dependent methyltransferase
VSFAPALLDGAYNHEMPVRWFPRLLLLAAGLVALLAAIVGGAIFWSRGPGLDGEVARLASLVNLRGGTSVAEIGAGGGRMAVRVAGRLGPSGRLYATEIEAGKRDAIRSAAAAAGLANIDVLEAGEHSAGLPEACCDLIYMRRVYHHFTDAASINKTLYAALRPGGRLAIIDFLSPRWVFWLRHGIPLDVVLGQITSAGFTLERRVEGWSPIDYCLVFRKPAAR